MSEHKHPFVPLEFEKSEISDVSQRAKEIYEELDSRRTVREFSSEPVPRSVIEDLILAASTAPSGAHKQPWTFCAVTDPEIKSRIRKAAEKEEYENYHGRMSDEWLNDLEPLQTDWNKAFLEIAPWLVIIFRKSYDLDDGEKKKNYYVQESVGIASGMLLSAVHRAGLVALTHTPSPMNFLCEILGRPKNEKPFLLIPVGFPADDVKVPDLKRKGLDDVAEFYE